jgi:thiol-disulfide isomerase/thioredoxin
MIMKKCLFLTLIMFCSALSGCVSSEEDDAVPFPSFSLVDESNNVQESSMYVGEPFVAYFSATWCTHCKPALGALDDTVPSGQVLIFNKDPSEGDMQEWKDNMESELERTLYHPFIHAPDLAASLEVTGIPTMFFIDSDGNIKHTMVGIKNQSTVELYWNDLS